MMKFIFLRNENRVFTEHAIFVILFYMKIPVHRKYLNRKCCLSKAKRLVRRGKIHGMTEKQVAQEIYFHAVVHRLCRKTGRFINYREHAGIVDMRDGGDTRLRRAVYAACWMLRGLILPDR